MAITGSNSTFVRYLVPNIKTDDLWKYVDEKLNDGLFKECEPNKEQSSGFTSFDDPFKSKFEFKEYHKGEFVVFSFRRDQKKVPSSVLKKHIKEKVEVYRSENGGKFPAKKDRQVIKEAVYNTLLNKAEPLPTICQVVWNTRNNEMFVGTTSNKLLEYFLDDFEAIFKVYPKPIFSVTWPLNLTEDEEGKLRSMAQVDSPTAIDDAKSIGYEFLTWLWFIIENDLISTTIDPVVTLNLGEKMVLALPNNEIEKVTCSTQVNMLQEAKTALKNGKMVSSMQIMLSKNYNEYTVTLDTGLFTIKGLKTPKQSSKEEDSDLDGIFLEKMFFLEEALNVLSNTYLVFIQNRFSDEWKKKILPQIKQWINA